MSNIITQARYVGTICLTQFVGHNMLNTQSMTQYVWYNMFDIKVRHENLTQWVQNNMREKLTAYLELPIHGYKPKRVYSLKT